MSASLVGSEMCIRDSMSKPWMPRASRSAPTGMSDGLNKYLCRLALLLEKVQHFPSGLSCLAEVDVTALLPGPKSTKSAQYSGDLEDIARRASRV
eukprot:12708862-Alexandrium_andersonii.AAC.1